MPTKENEALESARFISEVQQVFLKNKLPTKENKVLESARFISKVRQAFFKKDIYEMFLNDLINKHKKKE